MREGRDVSLRGLAVGASIIFGGIAASLLAAWGLVALSGSPYAGPTGSAPPPISGPALQTVPHRELEAFLRGKLERLATAGWVDRKAGIRHIPIEEAMRRVARGERP